MNNRGFGLVLPGIIGGFLGSYGGMIGTLGTSIVLNFEARYRYFEGCIDGSLEQGKFVNCTLTSYFDATCASNATLTEELSRQANYAGGLVEENFINEYAPYTMSISIGIGIFLGVYVTIKLDSVKSSMQIYQYEEDSKQEEQRKSNYLTQCRATTFSSERRERLLTPGRASINEDESSSMKNSRRAV